jgi:hypothetical protein
LVFAILSLFSIELQINLVDSWPAAGVHPHAYFAVNEQPVAVKNDEIDVQWHPSFLSTDLGKKIAHIGDRAYSPVLTEKVTVFRQAMFSAAKADRCHSRRDCRLNPSYAVLDDEATRRSRPHTPRGMKKQVVSDREVLVFQYSASSWNIDIERFRSEPPAAETAPRLAPGPSLLLALLLSLGLWGAIWWVASFAISACLS